MNPTVSQATISALQQIITGNATPADGELSPYRSGPELVAFFNGFGSNDTYSYGGARSRWAYAEDKLVALNGTEQMVAAVEAAVSPVTYLGTQFPVEKAVAYLNQFLDHEGLALVKVGKGYKLCAAGEPMVVVETKLAIEHASQAFIAEQVEKCDRKLQAGDFDGAITNARSAVEAVLYDIEKRLDAAAPAYDGDLPKLFKRVQKLLNLDPERPDISESLKQVLRGLAGVVAGLAPLRNKMGDAHVRTYKPARHHAKLAVNAAKTLLDFVFDTFEYQRSKGLIAEVTVREASKSGRH